MFFILVAFLSPEPLSAQCNLKFSGKFTDIEGLGTYRACAVGSDGLLVRLTDLGNSWTQIPVAADIDFEDIDFHYNVGWLAGGDGGAIMSLDDGTTWRQIYDGDVNAVVMLSPSTYLLATEGAILITNNEGATWSPILDDPQWRFVDIEVFTWPEGVLVLAVAQHINNNSSAIFKGAISGTAWQQVASVSDETLTDFSFPSYNIGYAVGEKGSFLKSTDGGSTWTNMNIGLPAGSRNVDFFYDQMGHIYNNKTAGVYWRTMNGGVSWESISLPVGTSDNVLDFVGNVWTVQALVHQSLEGASVAYKRPDEGSPWSQIPIKPTLSGPLVALRNESNIYQVPALTDASYQWQVTGGTITGPATGNSVDVSWIDDDASLKVIMTDENMSCSLEDTKTVEVVDEYLTKDCGIDIIGHVNDFHFATADVGYLVGKSGLIMKTTDGGATWLPKAINTTADLYDVSFLDEDFGLVAGSNGVFKTTDGGSTWKEIFRFVYDLPRDLVSVHIVDKRTYYCTMRNLLKTTDAGATWKEMLQLRYQMVGSIQYVNETTAFLYYIYTDGSPATGVIKTTDNWETYTSTWLVSGTDYHVGLQSTHFFDENHGVGVTSQGDVYEINFDRTNIWRYIFTDDVDRVMFNADAGFLFGQGDEMFRTIDEGKSWHPIPVPLQHDGIPYTAAYFFDAQHGIAATAAAPNSVSYPYTVSSKLFQTLDAGSHWTDIRLDAPIFSTPIACVDTKQQFYTTRLYTGAFTWEADGASFISANTNPTVDLIWNEPGPHEVTMSYSNGSCRMVRTLQVDVCATPPPICFEPIASIRLLGNSLEATCTQCMDPLTYQWYHDDEPIAETAGGTAKILEVSASGLYAVEITNEGGCSGTASVEFNFTAIGDRDLNKEISVYPVPSNSITSLKISNAYIGTVAYTLTSRDGRTLVTGAFAKTSFQHETSLSLERLPAGLYIVRLIMGEDRYFVKAVISE